MIVSKSTWMQVEAYLETGNTCVLPLGCTEQHAYLSLATDTILAEKVSCEAAEPLGVPVFPCIPYGMTPQFMAYPGTVSLSMDTYQMLVQEVLLSLKVHGFKSILIVNGHGGNVPVRDSLLEFAMDEELVLEWHDWWRGPRVSELIKSIEPDASHASWMENFPWTRVVGVASPQTRKEMIAFYTINGMSPIEVRESIGDGSFGGPYQLSDDIMDQIWRCGVMETRQRIEKLI